MGLPDADLCQEVSRDARVARIARLVVRPEPRVHVQLALRALRVLVRPREARVIHHRTSRGV